MKVMPRLQDEEHKDLDSRSKTSRSERRMVGYDRDLNILLGEDLDERRAPRYEHRTEQARTRRWQPANLTCWQQTLLCAFPILCPWQP